MTKGRPAMSIPRAATSVHIRNRMSPSLNACSHHCTLRICVWQIVWCWAVLCHTGLSHRMLCCTVPHCAVPCHALLFHAVSCHTGPAQISRSISNLLVRSSEPAFCMLPRTCKDVSRFVEHWLALACIALLCYQPELQQSKTILAARTITLGISMAACGTPAEHLVSGPCYERRPEQGRSRDSPPLSPSCP